MGKPWTILEPIHQLSDAIHVKQADPNYNYDTAD